MTDTVRTFSLKLATTLCIVVLVIAVRSFQPSSERSAQELSGTEFGPSSSSGTSDLSQGSLERPVSTTSPSPGPATPGSPSSGTGGTTSSGTGSTSSGNSSGTSGSGGTSGGSSGGTSGGGSSGGTPTVTYSFRNGTYSALGSYSSPGGIQSINVTLVISNDIVVDSAVTGNANSQPSQLYQSKFIDNYKPYVIGKKIDQLYLTKISGSSLTPLGFNSATDNIENQARI